MFKTKRTIITTVFVFAVVMAALLMSSFAGNGVDKRVTVNPGARVGSSVDPAAHSGEFLLFSNQQYNGLKQDLIQPYEALHNIGAARSMSKGTGVKVGVCDHGVIDTSLPELKGQFIYGTIEDARAREIEFFGPPSKLIPFSHGASMSMIIAGKLVPGSFSGIAPEAKLMTERFLERSHPSGRCIRNVALAGARVINHSLTEGDTTSSTLVSVFREDLDYAQSKGVIVIDSAGNNRNQRIVERHPARITVGQVELDRIDPGDDASRTTGPAIDVVAFGGLGHGYYGGFETQKGKFSYGSSGATAIVTGVVTLMLEVNPGLSADAVRNILTSTASDLGDPGYDEAFGYGMVNAGRAVACAKSYAGSCPQLPTKLPDVVHSVHPVASADDGSVMDVVLRNIGQGPTEGELYITFNGGLNLDAADVKTVFGVGNWRCGQDDVNRADEDAPLSCIGDGILNPGDSSVFRIKFTDGVNADITARSTTALIRSSLGLIGDAKPQNDQPINGFPLYGGHPKLFANRHLDRETNKSLEYSNFRAITGGSYSYNLSLTRPGSMANTKVSIQVLAPVGGSIVSINSSDDKTWDCTSMVDDYMYFCDTTTSASQSAAELSIEVVVEMNETYAADPLIYASADIRYYHYPLLQQLLD